MQVFIAKFIVNFLTGRYRRNRAVWAYKLVLQFPSRGLAARKVYIFHRKVYFSLSLAFCSKDRRLTELKHESHAEKD